MFEDIKSISNIDKSKQETVVITTGRNELRKYINNSEISSLGNTLKNNIEDSIDEYGDSISESEKIKILLEIVKKFMQEISMIYFDNAATTFPKPEEVYVALDKANRNYAFNAGRGSYKVAKNAAKIIDNTREEIASLVNSRKEEVVFTTSSTRSTKFYNLWIGLANRR